MKDFQPMKVFFAMNKLIKITQILLFTILIVLIAVLIGQFFNSYAQLFFVPLGILSVYYLLIYFFAKLLAHSTSKIWLYVGLVFIIMPLVAFWVAYKPVLDLSYQVLQIFAN